MVDLLNATLHEEMRRNPDIVAAVEQGIKLDPAILEEAGDLLDLLVLGHRPFQHLAGLLDLRARLGQLALRDLHRLAGY